MLNYWEAICENGISVLVYQQKGKADRISQTVGRQKSCSTRGDNCGYYDYGDHYDIKHICQLQKQVKNPGHSQTDITFCTPVRARILARIRTSVNTCAVVLYRHTAGSGQQCDWSYQMSKILICQI
jgi:hypothetical protein